MTRDCHRERVECDEDADRIRSRNRWSYRQAALLDGTDSGLLAPAGVRGVVLAVRSDSQPRSRTWLEAEETAVGPKARGGVLNDAHAAGSYGTRPGAKQNAATQAHAMSR